MEKAKVIRILDSRLQNLVTGWNNFIAPIFEDAIGHEYGWLEIAEKNPQVIEELYYNLFGE